MAIAAAPRVSVCIANYNGGAAVLDCIASVLGQQGHFQLEVIVHDDASTDDSPARIREAFPQIRLITSSVNSGYCISNNRMVAASSGQYLLLLNNDAELQPGSVDSLLCFAQDDHGDCILGLPEHQISDGSVVDRGYRTDPFLNPIADFTVATHEVAVATGACLWIPRDVWNAVGGFPEWFESVAEDIYLCMAARLLGNRVFVLQGPWFGHWVGKNLGGGKLVDGGLVTTVRRRSLSERNKTFVMLCCYPSLVLILLLPLHVLFLIAEAMFLLATGTGAAKVRRIYARIPAGVWRSRGHIRELRRSLMHRRRVSTLRLLAFTRWFPHKLAMLAKHGKPRVS